MNLKVLIVDDEQPARRRIEDLLEGRPDVEIVGSCSKGSESVQVIHTHAPDVVFLDVQMPDLDGFDVIREVGIEAMPFVVFVTAYDRYALRAFDIHALDYLLKPFSDDRFFETLARARTAVCDRLTDRARQQLRSLLSEPEPESRTYVDRLEIEGRNEMLYLPVEQVEFIVADGPYAEVVSKGQRLLLRERMHRLEERLDPSIFLRVHRSTIVNLRRVVALEGRSDRDTVLRLQSGDRVKVSRGRRDMVQTALRGAPR